MSSLTNSIALEEYLGTRVEIRNASGGLGWDRGVRVFLCPFCAGSRGGRGANKTSGWMNVYSWTAGCWNAGCLAEPRLSGGVVEWVRQREGLETRGQVWHWLLTTFPARAGGVRGDLSPRQVRGPDWVRWPDSARWLAQLGPRHPIRIAVTRFAHAQWSLSLDAALAWGLGGALDGRYASRVLIPITLDRQPVAFQARTWRAQVQPKYLTSTWGPEEDPKMECGRPARALLFNYDALLPGGEGILVEGPGDVMGWHQADRQRYPAAIGLLGTAMTPEKLALLATRQPKMLYLALDNEPAAQARALQYAEDLQAWSLPHTLGYWIGGKDAGSGARWEEVAPTDPLDIGAKLRARLGRR